MIFVGNRETQNRILFVEGSFGTGMSWSALHACSLSMQREAIQNNQVIWINYELGAVNWDDSFSQIIEE